MHRQEVSGPFDVGLDLLPEPRDVDVDGPCRRHRVIAPDFVEQLVAADRGFSVLDEIFQEQELASRQVDRAAGPRDLDFPEVDRDVPKTVPRCDACRRRATELDFDARRELHHVEGLRQIVVRAELQAEHLVDHLAPGREHDDGRRDALLPGIATDVEAACPGQHDVEQDDAPRLAGRPVESSEAVGRDADLVPLALQPVRQREHEPRLVLDEQDALRWSRAGDHHAPSAPASKLASTSAVSAAVILAAGTRSRNVVPDPGADSTSTRPPCDSAMRFTRLSPRPLPRTCASIARRPRKNGSKRWSRSAGSTPRPRSLTDTCTSVRLRVVVARTSRRSQRPSAPYLIALVTRF